MEKQGFWSDSTLELDANNTVIIPDDPDYKRYLNGIEPSCSAPEDAEPLDSSDEE